jgi:KaiC/GvpD/RAD55 family RecA-like ATPase
LFGLNRGEKVIFVSFEMTKEQIIRDCNELGLSEIEEHIESGNLKIIHIYGEDLAFPTMSLVDILTENKPDNDHCRIIVDPLTHYSMFLDDEKRKSISTIFQSLRDCGTSIVTLEESRQNDAIYNGSLMPLYLADTVLHLDNLGFGELFNRTLRVAKHRGSKHGEGLYPYNIESGLGIVIIASEHDINKVTPTNEFDEQFIAAIKQVSNIDIVGEKLAKRIEKLRNDWNHSESPEYILDLVTRSEK